MPLVLGGGPKCVVCGKTVYKAEEKISEAGIFHKACFRCIACKKSLDSFVCIRDGQPFCKSCYGKNFGPSGYGFGNGGAGVMAAETPSQKTFAHQPKMAPAATPVGTASAAAPTAAAPAGKTKYPENYKSGNERCPRCNDRVYFAEKMVANGINWHKQCVKCAICGKRLDSTTLTEREKEIYCKSCYGKCFGPKGFGYGVGSGTFAQTQ